MSEALPRLDAQARDDGFIDARARREYFLAAVATLGFSTTTSYSALVALVLHGEGYGLMDTGELIGVLAVTVLASTLLSGFITAKYGAVRASQLAMACACVGVGSMAFTRDAFWPALLSRLVWGFGVGLLLGPMNLYMQSRLTPKRFIYLVTAFSTMIPLSLAIGPPVGELLLRNFGATTLFIAGAMPAFAGLVLTLALRPLPPPPATPGLGLASAWRAWHAWPVMTLIVGGSQFGYITSYLGPSLEGRNVALAWFFLPATVAMLACRVVAMRWLSATHPRHLAAWGLVGCSLSLLAMAYAKEPILLGVAGVLLGLGNSMMYPVASAWLGRFAAHKDGGAVQAIVATAFYVGIYWTPWPQTFLIARYGYFGASLIMAAAGFTGAAALWASRADGRVEDARA